MLIFHTEEIMKTHKKSISIIASIIFLIVSQIVQGQNTLSLNSQSVVPGSVATVELAMNNVNPAVAFQLDVAIPVGFNYVDGSISLNPARITNHVITANIIGGSTLRIVSYSGTNATYTGNSGTIATFNLNATETTGVYPLNISNAIISNPGGDQILTGTNNGSITVAKGTPVVTWPSAASITYGSQLSAATLTGGSATYDGESVSGVFTYINPTTVPAAGTYSADVRFTPTNTTAYNTVDGSVSVTVNQKTITVTGITVVTKEYDGNTTATLNFSSAALSGVVGSDAVSLNTSSYTANFNNSSVGTGKPVTVSGLGLSGAAAGNYTLTQPSGLTGNITAKTLTVSGVTVNSKTYDGNTTATLNFSSASLSGVVGSDAVSLNTSSYTANFNNSSVGTGKPVTVSGLGLSGAAAGNYTLTQPSGLTGNITAKTLTVSGVTVNSKTYDGSTTATLNFASATLSGVVGSDAVSLNTSSYTANFNNSSVGTGKLVTVSGLGLSGAAAGNYTLTQPTGLTGNITAKTLTVSGVTVNSKTYDGNTTATLNFSSASLSGVVGSDAVSLNTSSYTANFNNSSVGTGKPVTVSGLGLSGAAAGNYTLTQPSGLTGNITAKTLTVSGVTVNSKTYDGNTTATLNFSSASLSGVIGSDAVSLNTSSYMANFNNSSVGTGKSVTVSGLGLSGAAAGNYTLTQPTGLTGTITAKALTVSGVTVNSKTYDGNTTATLNFSSASLSGVVGSDAVSLNTSSYTANFNNSSVGTGKPVTVSGLGLSGAAAGNYTLTQPSGLTGNITAKTLTVSGVTVNSKTYDGSTTATLNFASATLSGVVGSDAVSLNTSSYTANFNNSSVGTGKLVTVSGLGLSGAAAGNYTLTQPTGLTGNITAKTLTVSGVTVNSKTYDGSTTATLNFASATLSGVVGSDAVSLNTSSYTANFNNSSVGTGKLVTVSGLGLSGAAAGNYTLTQPSGLTGNITAKTLTVSGVTVNSKTYDGSTTATLNFASATLSGVVGSDAVTLNTSAYTANFNNSSVGTGKPVTVTGLSLSGATAGNYTLTQPSGLIGNITARVLTVSGVTVNSKTYDGNTTATLNFGSATLSGVVGSDAVSLNTSSYTANFNNSNVGTGKPVTVSGLGLSGAAAGNYSLTQPTGLSADITAKGLSITGVVANNRQYNGGTAVTLNFASASLVGVINPDDVSINSSGYSASVSNKHVGNGKSVSVTGVTIAGLQSGNYVLLSQPTGITVNITALPITITANSYSKVYGESDPPSFAYDASITLISGDTWAGALSREAGESVGVYNITLGTLSINDGNGGNNYAVNYVGGTLTIGARAITINAQPKTKVYGEIDPELTYQLVGTLATGDRLDGALTRISGENVGTRQIERGSLTILNSLDVNVEGNYSVTYNTANLTITTRPITVTADDKSKVYGAVDPELTYQITSGSLVFSDSFTGNLSRATGENVGTYAIGIGTLSLSVNYNLTFVGANLTITSRAITIAAEDKTKVYGDPNPGLTYRITSGSLASGDSFTGSLAVQPGSNVGVYSILQGTLSISPNPSNYHITFESGQLTITARNLTITANAGSKIYGDPDPALTYSSSGLVGTDAITGALTRVAGNNVGTYAIQQGTLSAGGNYTIIFNGANFTITPRDLTITANSFIKTYLQTYVFQNDEFTNTDLYYGDAITSVSITSDGSHSAALPGEYDIIISNAVINPSNGNYTISYVPGILTVSDLIDLELSGIVAADKVYDGTDAATITQWGTLMGVQSGDNVSLVTSSAQATFNNKDVGNGKTITITGLALTGSDSYKYIIGNQYVTANITPKDLTVTPHSGMEKVYGYGDPALTYDVTNGELFGSDAISGNLTRNVGENVGSYEITLGTLSAGSNYLISITSGVMFSITPRPITWTADAKTKVYGDSDPQLTYTLSSGSYVGNDADGIEGSLTREPGQDVGIYQIQQGTLAIGSNYNVTFNSASLSITAKNLTITANSIEKPVGVEYLFQGTEFTADGLVNDYGDAIAGVDLNSAGAAASAPTGDYSISIGNAVPGSGTLLGNYSISYVPGTMTVVDKIPVTLDGIIAENKVYDGTTNAIIADWGSILGISAGDDVEVVYTGSSSHFTDKAVGNGKTVTITGLYLTGSDAPKYSIGAQTTTANITRRNLTLSNFTANTKTYDGTTAVTGTGFDDDRILNDNLEFAYDAAFRYADVNPAAGNPRTVEYSNIQIVGGTDQGNYEIQTPTGSVVSAIYPRPLTITPDDNLSKVYGENDPLLTWVISVGELVSGEEDIFEGSLTREVGQNVGIYSIHMGSLEAGTNYALTLDPATFEIVRRDLTVKANDILKVVGQIYDFAGNEFTTNGLVVDYGDNIQEVTLQSQGASAEADVGVYPITITYVIPESGTDLDNYNVTTEEGELTVTDKIILNLTGVVVDDKTYDGTNTATIQYWGVLNGVETGDDVELDYSMANIVFNDKYVGIHKTVTISGLNLTGVDADKYYIGNITSYAAINPRDLLLSNFTADSKTYDGATDVYGTGFDDDRLSGDDLDFSFNAQFESPDVGTDKIVNYNNIAIAGGDDANNYTLISTVGHTYASIFPKSITVTADENQSKIFGDLDPVLTYTYDESQLIGSDALTGALGRDAGEEIGIYLINIGTLSAGGNYLLSLENEATFTIYGLLTIEIEPYGSGTASGAGQYLTGDEIVITATPGQGYNFDSWTNSDGQVISTEATFTYTMPATNVTLTANFEVIPGVHLLTLIANPMDGGTVTGGGYYTEGETVEVMASPAVGYQFVNWTDEGGVVVSTNFAFDYTMPAADVTLTANFEAVVIPTYTLTLVANPTDGGSVGGGGEYEAGQVVGIAATANAGYEFVNWTDDSGVVVSTNFAFDYTMPAADVTLTANFEAVVIPTYTLTLVANPMDGGSVGGGGEYEAGQVVGIAATANEGYVFVNWTDESGAVVSTNFAFDYTMPAADVTLTANFEEVTIPTYTLTLVANPTDGGSVGGGGEYEAGQVVGIAATANEGYVFVNWTDESGAVVSTNFAFDYTMPAADVTLTANFEEVTIPTYTLTLVANPTDGGSVGGGGEYEAGQVVGIAATANEGYVFVNWTDESGAVVSTNFAFDYTMPAADVTLTANFEAVVIPTYTLTLVANPMDGGSVGGGGEYEAGQVVGIAATANAGFGFVNWTDDSGVVVSTNFAFDYTMPAADVTLTANFEAVTIPTYTLTLVANPTDGGSVGGGGEYEAGQVVGIAATANAGYEFVNWTDESGIVVSTNFAFDYTMPAADVTLTANFEEAVLEYTITFTVHSQSGLPIEGAEVNIGGIGIIITNASGEVSTQLPSGSYSFVVTAEGYDDHNDTFEVSDADMNISVIMNPTGVDENTLAVLSVYPNPFGNSITLDNAQRVNRLTVNNIIGQKVLELNLSGEERVIIPTEVLKRGIYLMVFEAENGERIVKKMIKE